MGWRTLCNVGPQASRAQLKGGLLSNHYFGYAMIKEQTVKQGDAVSSRTPEVAADDKRHCETTNGTSPFD